jgi:hypothetical protein
MKEVMGRPQLGTYSGSQTVTPAKFLKTKTTDRSQNAGRRFRNFFATVAILVHVVYTAQFSSFL